jgi:hypothetical protein
MLPGILPSASRIGTRISRWRSDRHRLESQHCSKVLRPLGGDCRRSSEKQRQPSRIQVFVVNTVRDVMRSSTPRICLREGTPSGLRPDFVRAGRPRSGGPSDVRRHQQRLSLVAHALGHECSCYASVMTLHARTYEVGVRALHDRLSEHLEQVQGGAEVLVTRVGGRSRACPRLMRAILCRISCDAAS